MTNPSQRKPITLRHGSSTIPTHTHSPAPHSEISLFVKQLPDPVSPAIQYLKATFEYPMKVRREIFLASASSALVLVLFSSPFIFNELAEVRHLAEFRSSSIGKQLPSNSRILDFKRLAGPDGITAFCRFIVESGNDLKLDRRGPLPLSAQAIIKEVAGCCLISQSSLPTNAGDFDFSPNQIEPESWLIVFDREQGIGWIFVSE